MTLSFSEIIWFLRQTNKCLWFIGTPILTPDNWSTHTNLPHCRSTTINTKQTFLAMNTGFTPTVCCLTTYLSLLICVYISLVALWRFTNPAWEPTSWYHKYIQQFAYLWLNCYQSFLSCECISTVMHYTVIVIRHSEISDFACGTFIKIYFFPWWKTEELYCIFTVFTAPHNNSILYRCACWKFNFLAV